MRIAFACLVVGAAVGCSAPEPTRTTYRPGSNTTKPPAEGDDGVLSPDPNGGGGNGDTPPAPTSPTDPTKPDTDGDGIPDAEDCDPASAALAGTKLLDDGLATDKGFFSAMGGFPQASWTYDGTAYRQGRVEDAVDAVSFTKDAAIGDVLAEIRSASTEVATITPKLRQMFILVGATVTGGQLAAIGCGVEVAQGEATEQKTSIVRLAGAPGAVTTTVLQRVNRAPLQINEEFTIKARLALGTMTCDVTQGATTTTATATNLGAVKGALGLFTRQTKALFKQAKICKLK